MALDRRFWFLLAAAWALFAVMAAGEFALKAGGQPFGILDHQVAGTAQRVADIQHSWAQAGRLGLAQVLVAIDFVFMALAAAACAWGGAGLLGQGVRALGGVAIVGALLALGADVVETANQAMAVFWGAPSDQQAAIAAAAVEPKLTAYVVANGALLAGLVLRRLKN
jgi:hypothetical protein